MRKILLASALIVSLFFHDASYADEEYDPQHTMLALNMAIVSVHRILSANDRLTLNQEYQNIINNLSIGNIKSDPEITELYNKLITVIGKKQLREEELKHIISRYDLSMQNRFASAMSSFNIERSEVMGIAGVIGNLLSASIASYFRYQASEGEIRSELDNNMYTVQAEDMKNFDDMQNQLLSSSWNLMYKYHLPDEYRLVQKTMDDFYRAVEEPDEAPRRLRMLRALEDDFKVYPPYWYYRAKTAQEAGNKTEADKCFDRFDEIWRPVLRRDPYRLEVTKYRVTELIKNGIPQSGDVKQEVLTLLGEMRRNTQLDDWANNLFAGILYYALGDKESAEKCIEINIDYRYEQDISTAMLMNIRAGVDPSILLQDTLRTMKLTKLLIPVDSKDKEAAYLVADYFDGRKLPEAALKRNAAHPLILHTDMITALMKPDTSSFKGMYEIAKRETASKDIIYGAYSGVLGMVKSYADNDNIQAQIFLADMYNYGWGVSRDAQQAMSYYVKAGNKGDIYSRLMYINLMLYSESYPQVQQSQKTDNSTQVKTSYSREADALFDEGMKLYGEKKYVDARLVFARAAKENSSGAAFMIGQMLENGQGGAKNLAAARSWYMDAADRGHDGAKKALERLSGKKSNSWW